MRQLRGITFAAALLASIAALPGCKAGPDFERPALPAPGSYTKEQQPAQTSSAATPAGGAQRWVADMELPKQWWSLFESPALTRLVDQATRANPSIQASEAALRVAQENARAQHGFFLPNVQASLTPSRQRNPVGTVAPTLTSGSAVYSLYTSQLSIAYAPDVFGGLRRQVESLDAQAQAQQLQLEAAYLSVSGNVVAATIQEAAIRSQIDATQRIIQVQRDQLTIFQKQNALGAIALSDVAAQEALLAQTLAQLPILKKQLALQRDSLTALLGRLPADEPDETFDLAALTLPRELPLALPSTLVERRPDVRAAEAMLHAASAQIGVAAANILPQFMLTGAAGGTAVNFGDMFNSGNVFWAIAASAAQTLFDGGTLQARKRASVAAFDQAAAQYRSTVVGAFQNVADAMQAVSFDADVLVAQLAAERAAERSLGYARKSVELGASGYLALLNAQQVYEAAVISLAQARANRFADTAALFVALGGGWWTPAVASGAK